MVFESLTYTVRDSKFFEKIIVIQSHLIELRRKPELFNLKELWEAVRLC